LIQGATFHFDPVCIDLRAIKRMSMPLLKVTLLCVLQIFVSATEEKPDGSCGMKSTPDCLNDMGSCGNACCAVEYLASQSPTQAFKALTTYLSSGGSDGLFKLHSGGTDMLAGAAPPWSGIVQGSHTTYKVRYNDTLNFAFRPTSGGAIIRMFSISDFAGALGDMGQNRRTLTLMAKDLQLHSMNILFGCGSSPSIPTSSPASALSKEALSASPVDLENPPNYDVVRWGERLILIAFGMAATLVITHVWGHRRKEPSVVAPYQMM